MDKPAFNPNMPFQAVDKPPFDPSQEFQAVDDAAPAMLSQVTPEDSSPTTAATTGVIQGATMGFGDEAGALGSTALNAITGQSGPLAGGSIDDLVDEYQKRRDALRAEFAAAHAAHPYINTAGQLAGGLATGLGMGTPTTGLTGAIKAGAQVGAVAGLGNSNADLTKGQGDKAIDDMGAGLIGGAVAGAGGYGLGKAITSYIPELAPGIRSFAEQKAVTATGATGRQAENFGADAGRELLDRKIVTFGSDAAGVADKAEGVLNTSRDQISNSLTDLDSQGGTLSRDDVLAKLQSHIDELRADPSQNEVVKRLEAIQQSVAQSPENVSLSAAEKTKRGFQDLSNYNDPVATRANKIAAGVYRDGVEDSASALNPELSDTFQDGKSTYGLIAPIREAAAKRASQMAQSPIGGFGDVVSGAAGLATGGPVGAIASTVGRRVLAPRLASSIAVGADKLSDLVEKSPEIFGKYAPVLQAAAQRGTQSLAVAHYLLQQNDPAFREHVQGLYGDDK